MINYLKLLQQNFSLLIAVNCINAQQVDAPETMSHTFHMTQRIKNRGDHNVVWVQWRLPPLSFLHAAPTSSKPSIDYRSFHRCVGHGPGDLRRWVRTNTAILLKTTADIQGALVNMMAA